jgi:hypothetical protein
MKLIEGINPPIFSLSHGRRSTTDAHVRTLSSVLNESPIIPLVENKIPDFDSPPTTLSEIICANRTFYRWSCLTGIIQPDNSYQSTNFFFKYFVFKYRFWSFYLHFALIFQTIFMVVYLIYYATTSNDSDRKTVLTIVESFGFVLQNILLYPAIVYLRREISAKREHIDVEVYNNAMHYAVNIGRNVLILFSILLLTFVALEISFLDKSATFSILLIIGIIVFFTPTNFFLLGLLSFLIFEQRLSLHTMEDVRNRIVDKQFSYGEYFLARESIDKRDRVTPINWLLFAALINTILAIILIFIISEYHQRMILIFGEIFYILSGFGRQIAVLIVILLEIVKVNEIADSLLKLLVKAEWPENELVRLNLYVAMKDCPMGSSIFYFRPSKFQLMVQIVSSIVGMGIAIFWAVIFA